MCALFTPDALNRLRLGGPGLGSGFLILGFVQTIDERRRGLDRGAGLHAFDWHLQFPGMDDRRKAVSRQSGIHRPPQYDEYVGVVETHGTLSVISATARET